MTQQYQPDYMGYPPGSAPSSGLAIASMVCGIVSLVLVCLWFISLPTSIVAIVLGNVAKGQIRRGEAGGQGMATAGIICGSIALTIYSVIFIAVICGVIISALGYR